MSGGKEFPNPGKLNYYREAWIKEEIKRGIIKHFALNEITVHQN